MADLFQKAKSTINEHILNIYNEGELPKEQSLRKIGISDFSTKPTNFYNLDTIISVGYRVKSKRGTQFRIWANQVIKDHLIKGYSINQKRLEKTEQEVKFLRSGIQIVSRAIEQKASQEGNEYLKLFAKGLTLLDDFDHENLDSKGLTKRKAVYPEPNKYETLIVQMKAELDSDIFGLEKDQSFKSAIAQIAKGFGKTDFYPSLEEKAATLLYLIVKNHAFTDGNKRIAAACFLMFLQKNNLLINKIGNPIISNEALASLTLFIASSKPEEMDIVKRLVVSILNRNKN